MAPPTAALNESRLEELQHFLGGHSTGQEPEERRDTYRNPCQCESDGMSWNGNIWISYELAGCNWEGAWPQGNLLLYKRDRDRPLIVSFQVFASPTGAVADPEGVRGNPPSQHKLFHFHGKF